MRGVTGQESRRQEPMPTMRPSLRTPAGRVPLLVACCVGLATLVTGVACGGERTPSTLILAHYMPWFEARPTSQVWGWHWTMNAFDPESVVDGRRSIAAKLYPAIGPYDSSDPHVLEYHLLLMKLAGIDGVVIDWYGRADLWDYAQIHRCAEQLVGQAARLGLKVAVCYEDRTIAMLVKEGKIPADATVAHAAADVRWLAEHWFGLDNYVRSRGRPVLLSFGHEGLSEAEWPRCLEQAAVPVAYFSEHERRQGAEGGFDWPIPAEGMAGVDRFLRGSQRWPARIPVAFPRFLDIYAEAKVHPSWGTIPDDGGATFRKTLERALKAKPPFVQIATWNDWGEGTAIEPSKEYAARDLEVVQELRRRHLEPGFAGRAADLSLPGRLLAVRRATADAEQQRRLDAAVELLRSGDLVAAETAIAAMERR